MTLFVAWFPHRKMLLLFFLLWQWKLSPAGAQFDKTRAFQYLQTQCDFGSRYPGSKGHLPTRDFLVKELSKYADRVKIQPFSAVNYLENHRAMGYNIIASFGSAPPELLVCAHWDSRPHADQDPDPAKRSRPVPAANDGASGVAVLLELARNLKSNPPPMTVDIVLFDAEDLGRESHGNEFSQGARFFAKNLAHEYQPRAAILLDMVGDRDLQIYIERNSQRYAPELVHKLWSLADMLNIDEFVPEARYDMTDDHLPLIRAGIPAVDVIDFDYPYWHTTQDTPDKCSPESLEKVGQVLLEYIYQKN